MPISRRTFLGAAVTSGIVLAAASVPKASAKKWRVLDRFDGAMELGQPFVHPPNARLSARLVLPTSDNLMLCARLLNASNALRLEIAPDGTAYLYELVNRGVNPLGTCSLVEGDFALEFTARTVQISQAGKVLLSVTTQADNIAYTQGVLEQLAGGALVGFSVEGAK